MTPSLTCSGVVVSNMRCLYPVRSASFFQGLLLCFCLALAPAAFAAEAAPAAETPATPDSVPSAETPVAPAGEPATAGEPAPAPAVTAPAAAPFRLVDVEAKARDLAGKAYENPEASVPELVRGIGADQWNAIRFKPERALWKNEGLPFEVRFFHPGFLYTTTAPIHVLDNGRDAPVPFVSDMFLYGDEALSERLRQSQLGFAGFAISIPKRRPETPAAPKTDSQRLDTGEDILTFLGASYFRGHGKNALPGAYARGLALNTAVADGEEFPRFREFWLVKPKPGADALTVFALMDSPSMTGAYRFVITPGTSLVVDVECRLFPREGAAVPHKIGLAPLTSMFLFSEGGGNPADYRPEVHDSDGLLATSNGEWTWRPLANPGRLAVKTFPMTNPRGFGLMQRDDNFDHYQDIAARYERRSSLWVEPRGDWGSGRVELIEIPSREEIHPNIAAFWVADKLEPVPPPSPIYMDEPSIAPIACSYRLYWMTPGATPHELGKTVATRIIRAPKGDTVRFILDFEGAAINNLPPDTGLTSVVETPPEAPLVDKQLVKNPATGGWRLSFRVRLPKQDGVVQSIITARDGSPGLRFRALIKRGENLPDALTETWVYDLNS